MSCILLNWMRPYNIPAIVHSLQRHDFVSEVLCFDNSGTCPEVDGLRILRPDSNKCTYGRLLAAQRAQNRVIFVQDDDCLVRNVPALYERFMERQTHIVAALDNSHYRAEAHRAPYVLPGWGSVHLREWFGDGEGNYGVVQPYIERYGPDELLHRKFDRVYSTLHGLHDPQHADFERLRGPDGRHSDTDINALYRRRDHHALTRLAVERALELKNARRTTEAMVR